MPHREPFDKTRPLVAARDFLFAGKEFKKGDAFPSEGFNERLIRRQYEAHSVNHAKAEESLIKMTGPKGGRYTITAPWLDAPEVIRGKAAADLRLAELRSGEIKPVEGPAALVLVTIEGDKHTVSAPWLKPEIFDNTMDAEKRQAEIREAGPPKDWTAAE